MLSRAEAQELIQRHTPKRSTKKIPLDSALFHVLATPLFAQRCQPPFDRVMMDGIALHSSTFKNPDFKIQAFQAAGLPALHLEAGQCIEVATGAILPLGADTVIPYEDISIEGKVARLKTAPIKNQFIHTKGSDYPQGELLLKEHTSLGPSELALLASNGLKEIDVIRKPKVALISTGDELVELGETVREFEIYRSNVYGIQALLTTHHFTNTTLFHLKDEKDSMLRSLRPILDENDVLIFSGAVSKGKRDFLPEVLKELGINEIFHRVSQRPGKPLWFGVKNDQLVFGLPGNPVSTQVTLRDYVIPSLQNSQSLGDGEIRVRLAESFEVKGEMTHFIPARIELRQNELWASPVKINTSGDFLSLANTQGMLILDNSKSQNVFHSESFQNYRFWAKVF